MWCVSLINREGRRSPLLPEALPYGGPELIAEIREIDYDRIPQQASQPIEAFGGCHLNLRSGYALAESACGAATVCCGRALSRANFDRIEIARRHLRQWFLLGLRPASGSPLSIGLRPQVIQSPFSRRSCCHRRCLEIVEGSLMAYNIPQATPSRQLKSVPACTRVSPC